MKKTRRIAAFIAAMAMAATLAVPGMMMSASAVDETTGSISITNEAANHTYKAYQIFKGDVDGNTLSNVNWGDGVDTTKKIPAESGATLLDAIKAITLDTGIITTKNGSATTTPFAGVTDATSVAAVLSGGYYENVSATEATNFIADAEITKKFAAVVAQYKAATATAELTQSGTAYSASNVKVGYYLVIDETNNDVTGADDAYSRYIVQVLGTPTSISKKTDTPEVVKKVKENVKDNTTGWDSTGNQNAYGQQYNDVADYNFAETIPFELIGTMPTTFDDYTTYYYKFTDSYADDLFLITDTDNSNAISAGDFTVTVDGTAVPEIGKKSGANHTNFTVTATTASQKNTGFTVEFSDVKELYTTEGEKISVSKDSKIKVTYTATLNPDEAVIGLAGNENEVKLTYSNNPNHTGAGDTDDTHGETPEDTVIVFTYELDVTKYLDEDSDAANKAGSGDKEAKFKLQAKTGDTAINGKYAVVANGVITGWSDTGTELSTADGATLKFTGLDDGTYELTETKTPKGYNTMDPLTLVVEGNTVNCHNYKETGGTANAAAALTSLKLYQTSTSGTVLDTDRDVSASPAVDGDGVLEHNIINEKGSTLPSTGGMGTTLFVVGGGVTMAAAGIYLVSKKRSKDAE